MINILFSAKRQPGKSKEEVQMEKKQLLERRLEDVKDQLNVSQPKKTPKKSKIKRVVNFLVVVGVHPQAPLPMCSFYAYLYNNFPL